MPSWKKLISSGSSAVLSSLTLDSPLAVTQGGTGVTTSTGTTNVVLSASPTIVTPTIASFTNATHTHADAAGGGQITLGTGTTGNYVSTAVAGTGISVSGATGNVTITSAITAGDGLTLNTADIDIDASQTTLTSILNTSLAVGRDSTDQIKFGTDNQIIFRVGNADGVTFKASGEIEATKFDGALEGNADTATALAAAGTIASSGDVVWTVDFSGANVTAAATIQANAVQTGMVHDLSLIHI